MLILSIELDFPLRRSEIRYLRGAIAERVGLEHDLFHNHSEGRADRFHYRYPLIQYQARGGRAALVGLNAGAETLRALLDPARARFCGDLPVYRFREEHYPLAMREQPCRYALRQWLALNAANYARWQALPDAATRHAELERILVAHVLAFCEGLSFTVPRPRGLELQIEQTGFPRPARCHEGRLLAFDAVFQANIALPPGVGIGKAASHGFGTLWPARIPLAAPEETPSAGAYAG